MKRLTATRIGLFDQPLDEDELVASQSANVDSETVETILSEFQETQVQSEGSNTRTRRRREDAGEVLAGARKFDFAGAAQASALLRNKGSEGVDRQNDWRESIKTAISGIYGEEGWNALDELHREVCKRPDYAITGGPNLPNVTLDEVLGIEKRQYIKQGVSELTNPEVKALFERLAKELPWGIRELYHYKVKQVGNDTVFAYIARTPDLHLPAMVAMPLVLLAQCHVLEEQLTSGHETSVYEAQACRTTYWSRSLTPKGTLLEERVRGEQAHEFGALSLADKVVAALELLGKEPILNAFAVVRPHWEDVPQWRKHYMSHQLRESSLHKRICSRWLMSLDLESGEERSVHLSVNELVQYLDDGASVKVKQVGAREPGEPGTLLTPAEKLRSHLEHLASDLGVDREIKPMVHNVDEGDRYEGGVKTDVDAKPISEEELLERYGLRGIQYGNYVTQQERERALRLLDLAFGDLATALEVEPEAIGIPIQGKGLGIAIGARGRGKAAAHYEPGMHVINLTRGSGGGALGHEYAHALDTFMGKNTMISRTHASEVKDTAVAEWLERLKKMSPPSSWTQEERMAELDRLMRRRVSIENLALLSSVHFPHAGYRQDAMLVGQEGEQVPLITSYGGASAKATRTLMRLVPGIGRGVSVNQDKAPASSERLERTLEIMRDALQGSELLQCEVLGERVAYLGDENCDDRIIEKGRVIKATNERLAGEQLDWLTVGVVADVLFYDSAPKPAASAINAMRKVVGMPPVRSTAMNGVASRYMRAAIYYDKGVVAATNEDSSGYWTKPTELFARAFQGVLYEKLAEKGIHNEMLTAGGEIERWPYESLLLCPELTATERQVELREFCEPQLLPAIQKAMTSGEQEEEHESEMESPKTAMTM